MNEPITASRLRADIYRLLDRVLDTGIPLEVERNGRILRIVADQPPGKLERLVPHPDFIVGDPDDLVTIGWTDSWEPFLPPGDDPA